MEDAEDFIELGLEGVDKVVDGDYYGRVKNSHPLEKAKSLHPLDKARSYKQNLPFHHHQNSGSKRNNSAPANNDPYARDESPEYRDPKPYNKGRNRDRDMDRGGYDSPRSPPQNAPYEGPRDPYDRSWYHNDDALDRRDTRGSRRDARPRMQRKSSSAGPATRNERYANAGLEGYVPPAALTGAGLIGGKELATRERGGYIEDSDSDDGYRRRRARSADRERRRRKSRSRGRYDDDGYDESRTRDGRVKKYDRDEEKGHKREGINGPAWGAIAGGLLGSEMGKKSPIVGTFIGAGLGALGGKVLEKGDRKRREDKERKERRRD